jgi:DNA repair exonuclease SbcCD ATPase subunit
MAFASIEGKVTSIDENINSDEKTLSSIEIKDVLPLQTSLQLKREELAKIRESIVNASQLSDAVNRLAKNKKEYEAAEKLTATYTFILKELQVLPNKIFEKIISPIETGINEILAEIKSDWTIKFLFDGANLDICIKMPTGVINIDELSTGERVVINYVFKSLICKLIGFDTIVLDNTDALDVKNYAMVESVVEKSKYNTLLVNCGDIKTNFISICL